MTSLLPKILLLLSILGIQFVQCERGVASENFPSVERKQRGAHVFGIRDTSDFRAVRDLHVEWVTLVPWGFQPTHDAAKVSHSRDSTQRRQQDEYWIGHIEGVRAAGFKVFVKPHVWIHDDRSGKWRSDIFPKNDTDWEAWQSSYRDFILRYARVAERAGAEMFCVGTEFTRLVIEKPVFWKELIGELRSVYSGKLTYAANWYREFSEITFWDELDYIGVQAYFPLSSTSEPEQQDLVKGWQPHLDQLATTARKYSRPVVFTELGYRSTTTAAIEPRTWMEQSIERQEVLSTETQARCYEAFFETVWERPWFAGVHFWQLRIDDRAYPDAMNLDFSPMHKRAAEVIGRGFSEGGLKNRSKKFYGTPYTTSVPAHPLICLSTKQASYMIDRIQEILQESIRVKQQLLTDEQVLASLARTVTLVVECFRNDGKLLFCGNGGSAADAQHLAAELSGRFYKNREPLYAEALHVNSSYLTAVGNDFGYEESYARMVRAAGRPGDVLVAISTSGNSENILRAVAAARDRKMTVVGMTGKGGGTLAERVDVLLNVASTDTPRIQECHITLGHILCELVEGELFPD